MKSENKTVIVLSWAENSGMRLTGKTVMRDSNWFEETEACPKGFACVFSRDLTEFGRAIDYAKSMRQDTDKYNVSVSLMDDTSDVLDRARAAAIS